MLIKDLIEFGLSEKEAKVYVALLELEHATVQEAAKKADINRSSTYVVLEALKKRGLVSMMGDKKITHYVATSPEILLKTAEDMATKQEQIRKKIDYIIPELKALHKDTKNKPKIKVYEGNQGLISGYEDTLTSNEKLMRVCSSIGNGNLFKLFGEYFPSYLSRRVSLGIKMHGIHPDNEISRGLMKLDSAKFDESILIPKNKYLFPADLAIYDDKIAYMSAEKGGISIVIESKEMSEVMKSVFDMAFEEAKRLNKKLKK